jgi:DNA-binding CsgD family transcriptional regulator
MEDLMERPGVAPVAPTIAGVIDPMAAMAGLARLVADVTASVVVSGGGTVHRVPGLPMHPLLMQDSPVVDVARRKLANNRTHAAFLCPCPGGDGDAYVRVTALACRPQAPHHFDCLVAISPAGDIRGLTRRELEVLGLLIGGRSNQCIATALFITQRTVAAHLEHIRAKLDAPTRTVAAVQALHQALYVPHPLANL